MEDFIEKYFPYILGGIIGIGISVLIVIGRQIKGTVRKTKIIHTDKKYDEFHIGI